MKKSFLFLVAVVSLSILGYVVGLFVLCKIVEQFPAVRPFVFMNTHGGSEFKLRSALLQPAAFMAAMTLCLAFDAFLLGMDQSALKRLMDGATASSRVDMFYVVLRLIGGINVLVFVFSFGTLIWVVNQIHEVVHISILSHVHSYVIQFCCVVLINTFIGYWAHRFMHLPWMWEIHKTHHAAEEMNIVNSFRAHPVEQLIMGILNAFPVAMLGAATPVIFVYTAANLMYGSLAHSELKLKWKIWDLIWITPAAHRVHHSNRVEHFDTNFGILTFWDWLFGTYYPPKDEKLTYGVEDGAPFNRSQYLTEIFDNVRRWLRPLFGHWITAPRQIESRIETPFTPGLGGNPAVGSARLNHP